MRGIRNAKAAYRRKIEDHFNKNNPRWASGTSPTIRSSTCCFFDCFEVKTADIDTTPSPTSGSHSLSVQEHEVRLSSEQ